MSGSTFATKILVGFSAAGFVGKDSPTFAAAIGDGSMLEILGAPFDTFDTGTQSGTGTGTGTGLTQIVASAISLEIQLGVVAFTGLPPTPDMISMADAIADAFVQETALATLSTQHSPMATGTAIIIVGSIGVSGSALSASIESVGTSSGFVGTDWPSFAEVFGDALANALLGASADITVAGSPSDASPFSGPNQISPAGVLA